MEGFAGCLRSFHFGWSIFQADSSLEPVAGRRPVGGCAGLFYRDELESMDKVMPDGTLPTVADIWQRR